MDEILVSYMQQGLLRELGERIMMHLAFCDLSSLLVQPTEWVADRGHSKQRSSRTEIAEADDTSFQHKHCISQPVQLTIDKTLLLFAFGFGQMCSR